MNTRTIPLPVSATVNDTYQLLQLSAEAESATEAVDLDASNTSRFGPLGVAIVAASAAIRRQAGLDTELILPKSEGVRAFVSEVALDRAVAGTAVNAGALELRQFHTLDAVYTERVAQMLLHGVPGMTEAQSYPIQLCLNELLQNVFEWAESPIGCFVLARWYKKTRSVRLAVVDRGIGIPAALRREKVHDLHRADDAAAIEAAVTTPQLTSRRNRIGGLGLKTIREVVCGRDGRLTIVSLRAKVTWSGSRTSKFKSPALRGTAVEIDIRPTAPFHPTDHVDLF